MQSKAIVTGGKVIARYDAPAPFVGPDGTPHPAEAWALWTPAEWAAMCPGWAPLPLIDVPPAMPGKRTVPQPMDAWSVSGDAATVTYDLIDLTAAELAAQAAAVEAARTAATTANNAAAGLARAAYLTAVPGQETTYAAKQTEVTRWVEAGRSTDATAESYPWAGDRAELRGVTVAEVLTEWEAVTAAWETIGRQIEAERERVNMLIEVADTHGAIQAARHSAVYPSP